MFPQARKKIYDSTLFIRAILLMLGSLGLYVIQDSLVKGLPAQYSVMEIIFFRSIFSFIPILFFAYFERKSIISSHSLLKTIYLKGHIIRALTMFCSLGFYLTACRYIPLADAYTLSYTSPLFMTLLAAPLLGESVKFRSHLAVVAGFIGVMLVLRPGGNCFQLAGLSALLSGLFVALAAIWGRKLTFADSNTLIVVMYAVTGLLISSIFLPFIWVMPGWSDLGVLALIGIAGGIAQYGFTQSYRLAPVALIAPFDYAGLVWAIPVGYLIWGDLPGLLSLIGMMIIVLTGIYTINREQIDYRRQGHKAIYNETFVKSKVS